MKRISKPRPFGPGCLFWSFREDNRCVLASDDRGGVFKDVLNSKDCRRLAKWLERAAEYLESREGK